MGRTTAILSSTGAKKRRYRPSCGSAEVTGETVPSKVGDILSPSMQLALEIGPHPIICSDLNGWIVSVNPAFSKVFGYAAEEILGHPQQAIHPLADENLGDSLQLANDPAEAEHATLMSFVAKSGEVFTAAGVRRLIRDRRHRVAGFIDLVLPTVTCRGGKVDSELGDRQTVDEPGRTAAEVAHYVNNLLTVVSGNLQMMRSHIHEPSLQVPLEDITRACDMAAHANAKLLNGSHLRSGSAVAINTSGLIADLRGILASTLGPRVDLRLLFVNPCWEVRADRAELESAIINIVANARDAMPDGGVFEILGSNVIIDSYRSAAHDGLKSGFYGRLSFRDSGVGMTPGVMLRAFDPDFTTKEFGDGYGLGLSSVYKFANRSGGTVTLNSDTGTGTVVELYLPSVRRSSSWSLHPHADQ